MSQVIDLTLRTRTPLWTGGVEPGRMDRLHEAGIIGSLRWWYEAIVRALGGDVCVPTAEDASHRCPHPDNSYCDVCRLFGATGRARTFRLRLNASDTLFDDERLLLPSGRVHPGRTADAPPRLGGWYLFGHAAMGTLSGALLPLTADDSIRRLRVPLTLIVRHAALGAKVSNGYGVVIEDPPARFTTVTASDLAGLPTGSHTYPGLPDLRDFFFARLSFQAPPDDPGWWQDIPGVYEAGTGEVQTEEKVVINVYHGNRRRNQAERDTVRGNLKSVTQKGVVALAPAVRNWLRYQWASGLTDCQKYYLFGAASPVCPHCCQPGFKPDRRDPKRNWCFACKSSFRKGDEKPPVASKINVSHAYTTSQSVWEFRVWGWIPCEQSDVEIDRDAFLGQLKIALQSPATWHAALASTTLTPNLDVWHSRTRKQRDGRAYLEQLLDLNSGGTL